ncbi:MAG: HAD family hydrolase [Planctomycetota bacterium]
MLGFFPVRLYSYQFGHRKPDSGIFEAAAEKIGLPLEQIIYVGDRIDKDIEPAVKLGMTAVLKQAYTNQGKTPPATAYKIRLLSELPALIEKLNGQPATI